MKIVIAGGSGFVGGLVVERLCADGHEVVVLSRRASSRELSVSRCMSEVFWDGKAMGEWCAVLEGADALINLSGANISAGRWTPSCKKVLKDSRLIPTRVLAAALGACEHPPGVFINVSAVGYYGDAGDGLLDEGSANGQGFLAGLCMDWERAALEAKSDRVRVVVARMGIVLGDGGALNKFIPLFLAYLGGPLGSGRQWMSWISGRDLGDVFLFMIKATGLNGPVNCVSPYPVTMSGFCRALGCALQRPSWLSCPSFVLRLLLGEMSGVILSGQRAVPRKLLDGGFHFRDPAIKGAFSGIFNKE